MVAWWFGWFGMCVLFVNFRVRSGHAFRVPHGQDVQAETMHFCARRREGAKGAARAFSLRPSRPLRETIWPIVVQLNRALRHLINTGIPLFGNQERGFTQRTQSARRRWLALYQTDAAHPLPQAGGAQKEGMTPMLGFQEQRQKPRLCVLFVNFQRCWALVLVLFHPSAGFVKALAPKCSQGMSLP